MIKLLIKVKPNSAKDEISIDTESVITVKIRAKPIDGEANGYLVKYLAKEFNISRSLIQIEKGVTSRMKRIVINIEEEKWAPLIEKFRV
jgi:uncharacterized protein (TIGR00251 family)